MSLDSLPEPTPPPDAERHVRLYRFQWVGVFLLAVFPVLGALGYFGETWADTRAEDGGLAASIRYPDRFRYKELNSLTLQIRNAGESVVDTLTIAQDTALANRFSTVHAIPSFTRAYEVELTAVQPGETRLVVVELQAEEYGRHEGPLTITANGSRTPLRVPLSIVVFP